MAQPSVPLRKAPPKSDPIPIRRRPEAPEVHNPPPVWLKALFWLILGVFSVSFVEITVGSYLFPFFDAWGLLAVFPLYLLHIVVLATIVFRLGKPTFWTLFSAGMVFGMYEAYITKVVWTSFLVSGPIFSFAGIALVETIILVTIVHPFQAFIIPLLFSENLLTKSRDITSGLPVELKVQLAKRPVFWIFALMIYLGLAQFSPSPLESLKAGLSATVIIAALVFVWRKAGGAKYTMKELLPKRTGFIIFLILIGALYWVLGTRIKPEAIPSIGPQVTVWVLYAGILYLLFMVLKKSGSAELRRVNFPTEFSWEVLLGAGLTFSIVSSLARFLPVEFATNWAIASFAVYTVTGITLVVLTCLYVANKNRED